jgi:hypothetical protein
MIIGLNKVDLVAKWKWTVPSGEDMCGICRSPFEATCAKCKYPGDGCPLSMFSPFWPSYYRRFADSSSARRMQTCFPYGTRCRESHAHQRQVLTATSSIASSTGYGKNLLKSAVQCAVKVCCSVYFTRCFALTSCSLEAEGRLKSSF